MTDANTGSLKLIKCRPGLNIAFYRFPIKVQSHVGVTATTCFVRSVGENKKVTTITDCANCIAR